MWMVWRAGDTKGSELSALSRKIKDQAFSVKMAEYWPHSLFTSWYVLHTMRYSDGWICHSIPVRQLIYALNLH